MNVSENSTLQTEVQNFSFPSRSYIVNQLSCHSISYGNIFTLFYLLDFVNNQNKSSQFYNMVCTMYIQYDIVEQIVYLLDTRNLWLL